MSTSIDSAHSRLTVPSNANQTGIWKRLLWKDLRDLLPIWLTILFGAVVCVSLLTMSSRNAQTFSASFSQQTIISGIQAFAIMASFSTGVLLFAPERESGTVHLLRSLPILPERIVRAKLVTGLIGIIFMLIALTVMLKFSLHGSGRQEDWLTLLHADFWPDQLIRITTPVFGFLLGALVAMRTGSTFYGFSISAVIGIAAAFMVGYVSLDINRAIEVNTTQAVGSAVAVLVMLAGTLSSGSVWLEERRSAGRPVGNGTSDTLTDLDSGLGSGIRSSSARVSAGKTFWPLFWQSVRISRVPILILSGLTVTTLLAFCGAWIVDQTGSGDIVDRGIVEYVLAGLSLAIFSATVCIFGTVFWHDHQHGRFRFYQQHVERPRLFWLSRLLPWFVSFLFATFIALIISGFVLHWLIRFDVSLNQFGPVAGIFIRGASIFLISLTSVFAIGQWWSMQIRNPIIAIVFTLISTSIVLWMGSSLPLLGEPLIWFLPTVGALFWATWYRSKSWLADSATWRTYAVTFGVILATMGFSFAAFVYHRAYEYPDLKLDTDNIAAQFGTDQRGIEMIDRLQFGTPTERKETADMYRQAIARIKGKLSNDFASTVYRNWRHWEDEPKVFPSLVDYDQKAKVWVEQNREPLDLVLDASERIACDPFHVDCEYDQIKRLRSLVMASSLVLLQQNRNEEALRSILAYDRVCQRTNMILDSGSYALQHLREADLVYDLLIRWAEQPNQTVDAIEKVIDRLDHSLVGQTPAILKFAEPLTASDRKRQSENEIVAMRLWDSYTRWGGEGRWFGLNFKFRQIEDGELAGLEVVPPSMPWELERSKRFQKIDSLRQFQNPVLHGIPHNQPLQRPRFSDTESWDRASIDRRRYGFYHNVDYNYCESERQALQETIRRYTMLRLALAAYQTENEKLPATVNDLASYFDGRLPKTVFTSANFTWLPDGLPEQGYFQGYSQPPILPANVPLLLPYGIVQPLDTSKRESFAPDSHNSDETEIGIPINAIDSDHYLLRHPFAPVVKAKAK